MPFIVKAHDYADALPRRLAVREAHLAALKDLKAAGTVLYAAAILNDRGDMAGSLLVVDLPRAEIDSWLETEPYVTGKVWETVEILPCKPAAAN